jgi:hypothetical protein
MTPTEINQIKLMSYLELYSQDPVIHLIFQTFLGQVTVTYKKEWQDGVYGAWMIRVNNDEYYSFKREEVFSALRAACVDEFSFSKQLETTALTFASVALIGVDDLSAILGLQTIVSAKESWLAFMDQVVDTVEGEVKRTTSQIDPQSTSLRGANEVKSKIVSIRRSP